MMMMEMQLFPFRKLNNKLQTETFIFWKMKVSVASCAITFIVGWLVGSLCIFMLLTSLDQQDGRLVDVRHAHSSSSHDIGSSSPTSSFHQIMMNRDANKLKGIIKDVITSEFKSLGFRESLPTLGSSATTTTSSSSSSFDMINQLFKSYHFPHISSTSLSSSWLFHSFLHTNGDDDGYNSGSGGSNSMINDANGNKPFIFVDWPIEDNSFTIHNYHSLQTVLATFPQAIIRCLLPVPISSSRLQHAAMMEKKNQHKNINHQQTHGTISTTAITSAMMTWDEEHDHQKYPGILAKRQFQLYRKLGYDIDTISTMDFHNKIFRLFTFGQSYRKKWFTEYRKILQRYFNGNKSDESESSDSNGEGIRRFENDDESQSPTSTQEATGSNLNKEKSMFSLPPYHLLTYIRLTYLWKKGGLFMDFSCLFRNNPFHITNLDQGYYINSYCSTSKTNTNPKGKTAGSGSSSGSSTGGTATTSTSSTNTAVYRPKSYDSWRDLQCYTSTFFLFRYPQDNLLTCVLKKYDDEIFQVCIESDPFYGGADCILKAFHQCNTEVNPLSSQSKVRPEGLTMVGRSAGGSITNERFFFGNDRSSISTECMERFRDDPLSAKKILTQVVDSTDETTTATALKQIPDNLISSNISTVASVNTDKQDISSNGNSSVTSPPTKAPIRRKSSVDQASILWMGHLAWQGEWIDYPYPSGSVIDGIVQPAKAITHHHLKFLRRKIRIVEESLQLQQEKDLIKSGTSKDHESLSSFNKSASSFGTGSLGVTVVTSHSTSTSSYSSQSASSRTCHPFATSLVLPSISDPVHKLGSMDTGNSNLFTEETYSYFANFVVPSEAKSVISRNQSRSGISGTQLHSTSITTTATDITSQHLRGSRSGSSTPIPTLSPLNHHLITIAGGDINLNQEDTIECSPSIYMIGFKDTGSEIIRKLLDGNPFILSGWSQAHRSIHSSAMTSIRSHSIAKQESIGSKIASESSGSITSTSTASASSAEKSATNTATATPRPTGSNIDRSKATDEQVLGKLSSFVIDEEIGCYSGASSLLLQQRSRCFPFIESTLPVADNYHNDMFSLDNTYKNESQASQNEDLSSKSIASQIKYDKYSPALIFHTMDSSVTYHVDPITPFVIKQDNPHGKALFIISHPIERMLRTLHKHRLDIQLYLEHQSSTEEGGDSSMSLDDAVLLLIEKSKTSISQYRKFIVSSSSTSEHQQQLDHNKKDSKKSIMEMWLERYYSLVHPSGEEKNVEDKEVLERRRLTFFEELFYDSIYFPSIVHYSRVLGVHNVLVVEIDELINKDYFQSQIHNEKNDTMKTLFHDIFNLNTLHQLYTRISVPYTEPAPSSPFFQNLLIDMNNEFVLFDSNDYDKDSSALLGEIDSNSVKPDNRFLLSKDVYQKLVEFFVPFVEVLEEELQLNLSHWKSITDENVLGSASYYSHLPELSYGWNTTRPLLWFEKGYAGSQEDDEVQDMKGNILPHLLPQRTTEEDNGFNTTLGMLNTF